MFFIVTWDISQPTHFDGPFNSAEDAWSKVDDCRDEFYEQVTVLGPLAEVTRVPREPVEA